MLSWLNVVIVCSIFEAFVQFYCRIATSAVQLACWSPTSRFHENMSSELKEAAQSAKDQHASRLKRVLGRVRHTFATIRLSLAPIPEVSPGAADDAGAGSAQGRGFQRINELLSHFGASYLRRASCACLIALAVVLRLLESKSGIHKVYIAFALALVMSFVMLGVLGLSAVGYSRCRHVPSWRRRSDRRSLSCIRRT